MTRFQYLIANAAILGAVAAVALLIDAPLLTPALVNMQFGLQHAWYLLPAALLALWITVAPAWSWATMRRLRVLRRPAWWAAAPAAVGLSAVALAFVAEFFFPTHGASGAPSDDLLHGAPTNGALLEPRVANMAWNSLLLDLGGYMLVATGLVGLVVFAVALLPSRK